MTREPVLSAATIVGVILAVASYFNVVIDANTLTTVVVAVLPIIGALFARRKVTPTG